jgi:hypothetical protein
LTVDNGQLPIDLFFNDKKNIFIFLLHQEFFAGKFFEILGICLHLLQLEAVFADFLQKIGLLHPILFQSVDIFPEKKDIVVIDEDHPDTEYHESNQIFVCQGLEKFFGYQGHKFSRQIFHTKLENLPAIKTDWKREYYLSAKKLG